jgi:predicted membrane protein
MAERDEIEELRRENEELKKIYKQDERIEIANGYFELFAKEATAEEIEAYIEKYDLEDISLIIFAQEDEDEE